MAEPDEWLMQQVARGSARHLEPLIRRYAQPILTFTTRLLGSRHRGEEAFQETFISVWTRRTTYRYPGYFRPWLFRIAHNKCRELARPRDALFRFAGTPDPDELDASGRSPVPSGPVELAIAAETSVIVERAVARLPDRQRAVVVMRLWNAMSYTEIAEALEIAEPTVRSTMHDALVSVRRYLEPRLRA
jgi:RNA polymerase sigma factor (sigma-70 family)